MDAATSTPKIRPLTGQVLVEVLPQQGASAAGLFIPNGVQTGEVGRMYKGKVVAIGPWKKTSAGAWILPPFGIGAIVLINPYAGHKLRRDIGERLQLVRSEDVVALIENS